MKSLERFQFLANVLIVACSRPNAEVGKLVKAVVTYVTEGTRTDLGDLRLEAYFDLLIQDIDSLRSAAEAKSKKCSESAKQRTSERRAKLVSALPSEEEFGEAKCRTVKNGSSSNSPAKKTNAANATNASTSKPRAVADISTESSDANTSNNAGNVDESNDSYDSIHSKETATGGNDNDFNASDVTSSFERLKECYKKIGDNESQAFGVWRQLNEDERTSAFAYAQRLQGDLSSRTYLYVYLRDREWTKATSPSNSQGRTM